MNMHPPAAVVFVTIVRITCTVKTKQQAKQRYFAMPASAAGGMTETQKTRISGSRSARIIL